MLPCARWPAIRSRSISTSSWLTLVSVRSTKLFASEATASVSCCPTTAWWVYRLGIERAKRMLLTGDLIDARTAEAWGLVSAAVPLADLDEFLQQARALYGL